MWGKTIMWRYILAIAFGGFTIIRFRFFFTISNSVWNQGFSCLHTIWVHISQAVVKTPLWHIFTSNQDDSSRCIIKMSVIKSLWRQVRIILHFLFWQVNPPVQRESVFLHKLFGPQMDSQKPGFTKQKFLHSSHTFSFKQQDGHHTVAVA